MVRRYRFKRRTRYRRKYYGRRKRVGRRYRRRIGAKSGLVHFTRSIALKVSGTDISGGSGFGSAVFALSDLPNYAEIATMFDQYRVNAVVLKFMPFTNSYPAVSSGIPTINIPTLMYAIDYTDNGTPTSVAQLAEYSNCKTVQFNKPITIKFRPAVSQIVYQGESTNRAAVPKWRTWLDCNFPSIPHFALKFAWTGLSGSTTQFVYKLSQKYYLSAKNPR